MKKIFGFICGIFVISAACTIGACKINDANSDLQPAPSVEKTENGYRISFASITSMKYANVIRLKSDDPSFESNITEDNIGQVIPSDRSNLAATYMFEDNYTSTASWYKYKIRYYNGQIYSYTDTNSSVLAGINSAEASLSGSAGMKLKINYESNVFTYDLDTSVTTEIEVPSGFDEVDFLVANSSVTRPFKLGTVDDTTNSKMTSAAVSTLDLQKTFSTDFLDTPVTFEGIIAIDITKGNEEEKTEYTRYYWTTKGEITLKVYDKEDAEGYYTDSEGNAVAVTENVFTIPTPKNPDNGFDFSCNILAAD